MSIKACSNHFCRLEVFEAIKSTIPKSTQFNKNSKIKLICAPAPRSRSRMFLAPQMLLCTFFQSLFPRGFCSLSSNVNNLFCPFKCQEIGSQHSCMSALNACLGGLSAWLLAAVNSTDTFCRTIRAYSCHFQLHFPACKLLATECVP